MRKPTMIAAVMLAAAGTPQMLLAQHGGTLPSETAAPTDLTGPPVPGLQPEGEPDTTVAYALTGQARAAYDSWPAERRATYDAWPPEYRAYFWNLNPTQQRIWLKLTDQQKATVFGLTPGQRLAAWQVIESRIGAAAPSPQARVKGR